jgi:hypothetical protein
VSENLPFDLNPIRGLVTRQFQTPLCHVSLLCSNRKIPNMAFKDALLFFQSYDGKLIHLEINQNEFKVKLASETEEQS